MNSACIGHNPQNLRTRPGCAALDTPAVSGWWKEGKRKNGWETPEEHEKHLLLLSLVTGIWTLTSAGLSGLLFNPYLGPLGISWLQCTVGTQPYISPPTDVLSRCPQDINRRPCGVAVSCTQLQREILWITR